MSRLKGWSYPASIHPFLTHPAFRRRDAFPFPSLSRRVLFSRYIRFTCQGSFQFPATSRDLQVFFFPCLLSTPFPKSSVICFTALRYGERRQTVKKQCVSIHIQHTYEFDPISGNLYLDCSEILLGQQKPLPSIFFVINKDIG